MQSRVSPGTDVTIQEVIDPRTCSLQAAVGRRDESAQTVNFIRRLGSFINGNPDARFFNNFAGADKIRTSTRTVSHLLRTSLRTDVLHAAEHAIPARLTAEQGSFNRSLNAFQLMSKPGLLVHPSEDLGKRAANAGIPVHREQIGQGVQYPGHNASIRGSRSAGFVKIKCP